MCSLCRVWSMVMRVTARDGSTLITRNIELRGPSPGPGTNWNKLATVTWSGPRKASPPYFDAAPYRAIRFQSVTEIENKLRNSFQKHFKIKYWCWNLETVICTVLSRYQTFPRVHQFSIVYSITHIDLTLTTQKF